MFLRRATPHDAAAIRDVHTQAFGPLGDGPSAEAQLVDALLADGDTVPGLSIVAMRGGEIVGHVVCSRGHIESDPALGLGPLGVVPKFQRRGVGSALVHGALAAADALGEACVAVLGDARYYAHFGFEAAAPPDVLPEDPAWAEHFQLRRLAAWHGDLSGVFHYAEAFHRM